MLPLCEPVIDVVLGAGVLKSMGREDFASGQAFFDLLGLRTDVARRGEVGADFVRYGRDQRSQEIRRDGPRCFLMQFGKGELRCPVDGHEEVELAFLGPDFGDVDVKVADRIFPESLPCRSVALQFRKPADAMALIAAMQGRARQCGIVA